MVAILGGFRREIAVGLVAVFGKDQREMGEEHARYL
jgi:hypothetical protein